MSTKRSLLTGRIIPILAYHTFETSSWKYALEPALFDEHLDFLKSKRYVSITLSDYAHQEGMALSTKPVILTFNGASKSFEAVLPTLEKHHFKATIFVPTAYVGKEGKWLNQPSSTIFDWEMLRHLSVMGMEIGSHGHEHLQLDVIPDVLARHDVHYSKVLIEENIGKPCTSFAYPYGYYNTQVRDLVRTAGFSLACTLEEMVSSSKSDHYTLPRLPMSNRTTSSQLKTLIRQKDISFSAYSAVKSSLSRQLRRLTSPLRKQEDIQVDSSRPLLAANDGATIPTVVNKEAVTFAEAIPESVETPVETNRLNTSDVATTEVNPVEVEINYIETAINEVKAVEIENTSFVETMSVQPQLKPSFYSYPAHIPSDILQLDTDPNKKQLEAQGEYLAICKTVLRAYPYTDLTEYHNLHAIAQDLHYAQEEGQLFDNFEQIQEAYTQFEQAITAYVKVQQQKQKKLIEGYLYDLQHLPTPALQTSADRIKTVLESYKHKLQSTTLNDADLKSAEGLIQNFKQRLELYYRQQLMQLVQKASKHNALEVLKSIQHATILLEQGEYPKLEQLETSLNEKIAEDKRIKQNKNKVDKYNQGLQEMQHMYDSTSHLNNEYVYKVDSMLQHLNEQQANFPYISSVSQDELMLLLKEVKSILKKLVKEYQTTALVALHIVTSNTLENAFSIFDEKPDSRLHSLSSQDSGAPINPKN
jgi:peptidoglycan/xylan/chitin deacetylase (PgdA/CDA1 family)